MRWVSVILVFALSALHALPKGERVVAGVVSSDTTRARELNVTASDKSIIEYDFFGISKGEKVTFFQPNENSTVLARVVGSDLSEIYGQLNANGHLFMVNPQGIYFGRDSQVNVGSFVASTMDIADRDFAEGKYSFVGEKGSIVHEGEIRAEGSVAFLAPRIENRGLIVAKTGSVVLASAKAVTLDFAGDGLIRFVVDEELVPDVGVVSMQEETARDLVRAVVNVDGIKEGVALVERNGAIELAGGSEIEAMEVAIHGDHIKARDASIGAMRVCSFGSLTMESPLIDLLVLDHPRSIFASSGPMTLISDAPISADAHFWSGNFSLQKRDGSPGDFFSLYDPIVSASGSVSFGSYSGAALLVQATGQIAATGSITVTTADVTVFTPSTADTALLNASPALILRSGLGALVGYSPATTSFPASIGGATFSISGATPSDILLGGNITTSSGPVLLSSISGTGDITLTANVTIDTSGGDVTLDGTVNGNAGNRRLTLDAGAGDITVTGDIGGVTPPQRLTVADANDATFEGVASGRFVQSSGTGTTTVNGAISTTDGTGVRLDTAAITINGDITTAGSGELFFDHTGLLTVANGTTFTLNRILNQNGPGDVLWGADVTTTNDNVTFSSDVTFTDSVSINTGAGNGRIRFDGTVDGTTSGAESLMLTSGNRDVIFNDVVGGTTRIGDITASGRRVEVNAAYTGAGFDGTSTMTMDFGGAVNLTGSLEASNAGTLTIAAAADMTIGGIFNQNGAGGVSLAGDITTSGGTIDFTGAVSLSGAPALSSSGGDVSFASTVNGGSDLSISAGSGTITFTGAVGSGPPVSDLTIVSADDVSFGGLFSGSTLTQSAGTGTTSFASSVTTSGASGITLTTSAISFTGPITTTGGGPITLTNAGMLTIPSGATVMADGAVTQSGGGAVSIGADITTTGDAISFASASTLTAAITFTTSGGSITTAAVDGAFDFALFPGTGAVTLGALGGGTSLGDVTINDTPSSVSVTSNTSATLTQAGGTGTSTYGPITTSAAGGISLTGSAFGLTGALTTSSGGGVTITNTGLTTVSPTVVMTLDGPFFQSGGGSVSAAGSITTTGDDITFTNSVIGGGDLALSSGSGDIFFLSSATLGDFTITSGDAVTFTSTVSSSGSGGVSITSSGVLTIPAAVTSTGPFSQMGASSALLGGDVSTTSSLISFGSPVDLTSDVALDTGPGVGDISFADMVDGTFNFDLTAGSGDITFAMDIGGGGFPLDAIAIHSAKDVSTTSVTADSVSQTAGTGTTTVGGFWTLSGAAGVALSTTDIRFGAGLSAPTVTFAALGTVANLAGTVPITTTGVASFNSMGGDVGTAASPIEINTPSTISAGADEIAYFTGSPFHFYLAPPPAVLDIFGNEPCGIFFNGTEIKVCNPVTPVTPSAVVISIFDLPANIFYVVGIENQRYSLASAYYFRTYLYNAEYLRRLNLIFWDAAQ